jgi:hypothetical protein
MCDVAVVKYKEGLQSLKKTVDLGGGQQGFSGASKVVIKPNMVAWRLYLHRKIMFCQRKKVPELWKEFLRATGLSTHRF